MKFNKYSNLEGQHAFLSASKHHWVNYTDEKLAETYRSNLAAQKGTELHDLARRLIENRIKLPRSSKTLNSYVNDAIGFRMTPEQVLYYSDNSFGTADAISFDKDLLRIHDLKTGVTPASMRQLRVYNALFCLEYNKRPEDIQVELRMYINDEVIVEDPDVEEIRHIMNTIVRFDSLINDIRAKEA